MRKIYSILAMSMIALASVMFTSCTEDQMIGSTLTGTWEGNMYVQSEYNGRYYPSSYTQLEFSQDPFRYTSGTGYWIDYYSNAPWRYIASHIRWKVKNSEIEVYFIEDDYYAYIRDYSLNDYVFRGYLDGENYSSAQFSLRKTSNVNWNEYDYGYYSYAKVSNIEFETRAADSTADNAITERPKRHIIIK